MRIPDWLQRAARPDLTRAILRYCLIPALIFYLVSLAVMAGFGFSMIEILRDPAQQTDTHSFLGFVSTVGTWLWLAAAVLCAFRAGIWRGPPGDHLRLLRLVGGFSLFLAVDDFFLIHDRYITEGILIPAYALFLGWLVKRFWGTIEAADGVAFLTAGGMLFFSVLVDAVQEMLPIPYGANQAIEEGFKFLGAAAWAWFGARLAAHDLYRD